MANQYIYNLTDTWNNVATTFDAIKMNVTDTASAAGSKLLNLQVGGSTKFAVGNDGSLTLENSVISYSKIQNVSATDKLLGRSTAGAGVIEEVTCTAAGRALLDDASAADQRTTLGLGSTSDVTFAGLTVTEDALNATPVTVSGYSLTGANVQPLMSLAGTWNTSGNAVGINLNITNTASGASSDLMRLQTGGTNQFRVTKAGGVKANEYYVGDTAVTVSTVWIGLVNTGTLRSSTTETKLLGTAGFGWVASNVTSETIDTALWRDAANNLAQRNGTNAQTFRVYNTFTDASNYERGKLEWSSNVLRVGTEKAGTGTARALELQTDGTTRITLAASSSIVTFAGSLALGSNADISSASGRLTFGVGVTGLLGLNAATASVVTRSSGVFGFVSGTDVGNSDSIDLRLARDAANILAQRSGTNAQTFNIYNTYTSSTNYERLSIEAQSNAAVRIRTNKGSGGGAAQALELGTDATTALTLTTAQKAEFAATIKTAAPSGGTAAEWKLGTVATATPTSPNRTIEVDIGGTIYYVHAKTTND
jgi:hypothetical protein